MAGLARTTRRPTLVVAAGPAQAHALALDIGFFLAPSVRPGAACARIPPGMAWRGGRRSEHDAERALVCHRLLAGDPAVVVATAGALSAGVPRAETFRSRAFRIGLGDTFERDALGARLEAAGYERVESVVEVGQWSARGGIVDVFSPAHDRPVRAEFFGDEVESLRPFDPTTQRSVDAPDELASCPLGGPDDTGTPWSATCPPRRSSCSTIPPSSRRPRGRAGRRPLVQLLGAFQRLELPLLAGEPARSRRHGRPVRRRVQRPVQDARRRDQPGGRGVHGAPRRRRRAQAGRVGHILSEHGLEAWPDAQLWSAEGLGVLVGDCATGFQLPALGLVVLAEQESSAPAAGACAGRSSSAGRAIASFTDLAPSDLVVHESHGIGRYHGLAPWTSRAATPTSCSWSTARAGGSTCPSIGST